MRGTPEWHRTRHQLDRLASEYQAGVAEPDDLADELMSTGPTSEKVNAALRTDPDLSLRRGR